MEEVAEHRTFALITRFRDEKDRKWITVGHDKVKCKDIEAKEEEVIRDASLHDFCGDHPDYEPPWPCKCVEVPVEPKPRLSKEKVEGSADDFAHAIRWFQMERRQMQVEDLDPSLRRVARGLLADYAGDIPFLLEGKEMEEPTDQHLRGVLNWTRPDLLRLAEY